jgi:hypothetical protein
MNDALNLTASFRISEKKLVLKYEVANRSKRDTYLLNRLYRSTPEWQMTPDVIYAELDRATQTVILSKRLADLPKGLRITTPVAPFVTPLRAGTSFSEEVNLNLPLSVYRQYPTGKPAPKEGPKEKTYHRVRFILGFYWRPEGTVEEKQDVQGTEVVVPRTPPGKQIEFGSLESDVVLLDIPVLEPVSES